MSDEAPDTTSEVSAPEGAPAPSPAPADGGADYGRLLQRVDELGDFTAQQMRALEQRLDSRQQEPDFEPEYELGPDDPDYEAQQFQQYLDDLVAERVQQGVQAALTPFQEKQQAAEYNDRVAGIEGRYSDLLKDGKPSELAESVMNAARQSADMFGIDANTDPRFWDVFELSYKAHKADAIRGSEAAPGGNPAALESGGASAGQSTPQVDEQQRLMAFIADKQRDLLA